MVNCRHSADCTLRGMATKHLWAKPILTHPCTLPNACYNSWTEEGFSKHLWTEQGTQRKPWLKGQLSHVIEGNVAVQRDEGIHLGSWDKLVVEPRSLLIWALPTQLPMCKDGLATYETIQRQGGW